MNFDPMKTYEKTKDDWYAKPAKRQKRKLTLLPTRKYVHFKGTMKRVRVEPAPAVPCVVMRWMDGETNAIPCWWNGDEKFLFILSDQPYGWVFDSRSEAKKAIWHTVQYEGIPGGHVDFVIVNKMSLQGVGL